LGGTGENMRITLTLMIFLFTFGCTSTTVQPQIAASPETLMAIDVTDTPTMDGPELLSTGRVATVFSLQTASATPPPTHPPTETLTPTTPALPTPTSMPLLLSLQGPWLLYLHTIYRPGQMDQGIADVPEEFVLLNQDGSGRTSIHDVDTFLMDSGSSKNYMTSYVGEQYLFRPSEAKMMFIGDESSGVWADFYQASDDVSPELMLYELPSGKIRDRFPLVRCSKDTDACEKYRSNWREMMRQQIQWSPNGRYLAFVAIMDATSSDLFVYDIQTGHLRRVTDGPDWVGPIEWSPDGTHIIMQELLNERESLLDPNSKPPSSVWSVSISTNEIKQLYSTGEDPSWHHILQWLDDHCFIAYDGFLVDADQARDLRFVDMETGTSRILFDGIFIGVSFDPVHDVYAIYEQSTDYCLPSSTCLVSIKDGTIRPLDVGPYSFSFPWWDENSGLFVFDSDCENDPQSLQAVDYQGAFRCVPKSGPTPTLTPIYTQLGATSYPAPDRQWQVSVKDGLWLEKTGEPAVQISKQVVSNVIWCPDSSCFYFLVPEQNQTWTLYHVSMSDRTVKLVDDGLETGNAQWLEDER